MKFDVQLAQLGIIRNRANLSELDSENNKPCYAMLYGYSYSASHWRLFRGAFSRVSTEDWCLV